MFVKIFEHSVIVLKKIGLLDTSILHGDVPQPLLKKAEITSDTADINIYVAIKSSLFVIDCAM